MQAGDAPNTTANQSSNNNYIIGRLPKTWATLTLTSRTEVNQERRNMVSMGENRKKHWISKEWLVETTNNIKRTNIKKQP